MNKLNNKKGISLIVLVITIIVMIILAAAIILSLSSNGIIGKANKAQTDTNNSQLTEAATLHLAEYDLLSKTGDSSVAGKDSQTYVREKLKLGGFTEEEVAKVTVVDGKLVIASDDVNMYNGVRIPEGFVPSIYEGETDVENGLVIYQTTSLTGIEHEAAMTTYNQYVWIPKEYVVEEHFGGYEEEDGYVEKWGEYNIDSIVEKEEYDTLRKSIEDNGGFYIAKYDAGLPSGVTVDTANYGQNNGDLTIPVSVKNATPWTYIPWDNTVDVEADVIDNPGSWDNPGCAKVARAALNTSDVKSHLIYWFEMNSVDNFESKINKEVIYNTPYEDAANLLDVTEIQSWRMTWKVMGFEGELSVSRDNGYSDLPAGITDEGFGFRVALYLQ